MKQKLFILDPSKDITGAFMCAKNEARILKDSFEITLVIPSISKIDATSLQDFDNVVRLPIYDIRKSFFSILIYFPALIYSGFLLKSKMKKENCTLLQVNDYYLMQGVLARLFGFRGKIITWVRIDPTRYGSFFSKYWLKYAYWASDAVVAVSQFILHKLPESSKNRLLYDSVSSNISTNIDQINNEVRKLIYIGNYTEGKGQQHAIKAFEKVAAEFDKVELHFYGGDMGLEKNKKYKAELQKLANGLYCKNRIFFHGFTNDTATVLKESYMALNFSESESFSMTCLEASNAGLSVVATRSGGPEEIIVDGQTGYLVEKGNITQMAEAMRSLLKDEDKNRMFGNQATEYVKDKFSSEVFYKKIVALFGEER